MKKSSVIKLLLILLFMIRMSDLLDKMQLSRIVINPMTQSVNALGGGEVQLRMNGIETTGRSGKIC
jgi:hypothetical protein